MDRSDSVERALAALLGIAIVAFVAASIAASPLEYTIWSDRDLWRAAQPVSGALTLGAELSYGTGARVPGGAYLAFLKAFQAVSEDPVAVQRGLLALEALGLAALAATAWRLAGAWAGALTAAVYLGLPIRDVGILQIWNPAFVLPLLSLAVAAWVDGLLRDRAWPFAAFGVVVGLAAHTHLSVGIWATLALAGLALARPALALRAIPAALLGMAVTYVPYLIHEAQTGWVNTTAMTAQPHLLAQHRPPTPGSPREIVSRFFQRPLGDDVITKLGTVSVQGALPLVGFALGLVAGGIGWRGRQPTARSLTVLAAATGLGAAYFFSDPYINPEPRYYVSLVPGFALVAGVGLARAAAAVRARHRLGAALLQVAITAWAALPLAGGPELLRDPPGASWTRQVTVLDALADELGGPAAVAGRLVLGTVGPQGEVGWRAFDGRDDWLRRHGDTFPGSLPPPCWLWVQGVRDGRPTPEEAVASALGVPAVPFEVVEVRRPLQSQLLVAYTPALSRCPTSLSDRYLDTPTEARLREVWFSSREPGVHPLPVAAPDEALWAVLLPASPRDRTGSRPGLALGVSVRRTAERAEIGLHANQLRGASHLAGWHVVSMIADPTLVLTRDAERVEIPLVEGLVGRHRALTPLRTTAPVPPGSWSATLEHTPVVPPDDPRLDAPIERGDRVQIPLGPLPMPSGG